MRRGYSKKSASPLSVSGVWRCHTSHGSTLLARDAQTPGRTTATRAGRTNGRANARQQVRHSVEQLAAAEGVQRGNWPLVTSCNGKAPARSSRAAREWYSRRVSWGASTVCAPLCPPLCGFVSVKANLNGPTISLRGRKVKSPLYPGARGRPRGPPLPGWRLYRIPRNTRHCRGGACPRPREAPRAAPAWLGAAWAGVDSGVGQRCGGRPPRGGPPGPPRAGVGQFGAADYPGPGGGGGGPPPADLTG